MVQIRVHLLAVHWSQSWVWKDPSGRGRPPATWSSCWHQPGLPLLSWLLPPALSCMLRRSDAARPYPWSPSRVLAAGRGEAFPSPSPVGTPPGLRRPGLGSRSQDSWVISGGSSLLLQRLLVLLLILLLDQEFRLNAVPLSDTCLLTWGKMH